MSKTDSLHYQLCCEAAMWLKKTEWGIYKIVAVELNTMNPENPDIRGTTGFDSMVIEVKTSRADFLQDRKKKFRQDDNLYKRYAVGNRRYYLAPKGLISVDELPTSWGLLEWDSGEIKTTKIADRVACENAGEVAILCSIMRREGIKNGVFNYRKATK